MKTTTLASILVALAACHHDKPAEKPTVTATDTPPPAKDVVKSQPVDKDTQVSPGLAVSGDIASACGIKAMAPAAGGVAPKFDYDKDDLTAEDRAVLDQIATCLTTGPLKGKAVSLIGRADPRGTEEYNLGLGSRRSASVGTYLGHLGVPQPQLAVTTRGAIDATGTDEAGWKTDRRVDIQLKTDAS